jgi:hypothetical protein
LSPTRMPVFRLASHTRPLNTYVPREHATRPPGSTGWRPWLGPTRTVS